MCTACISVKSSWASRDLYSDCSASGPGGLCLPTLELRQRGVWKLAHRPQNGDSLNGLMWLAFCWKAGDVWWVSRCPLAIEL